jgi:hypothetical protein
VLPEYLTGQAYDIITLIIGRNYYNRFQAELFSEKYFLSCAKYHKTGFIRTEKITIANLLGALHLIRASAITVDPAHITAFQTGKQ